MSLPALPLGLGGPGGERPFQGEVGVDRVLAVLLAIGFVGVIIAGEHLWLWVMERQAKKRGKG